MILSAQQLQFFDLFGYLSFPGLLSDRIAVMTSEFEAIWARNNGGHHGAPHDGKMRSCIVPFLDQSAELCTLLDDPRILGIASSLLGDDFNYLGSDGNYYVGETGWHSDGQDTGIRFAKIAFYLDDLDGDSGALRVIPGSHRFGEGYSDGLSKALGDSGATLGKHGREIPAIALRNKPGDVIIFNHNLKHASFNGGPNRRMFTINLCQRHPESRLPQLREYISWHARFWIDRVYGPIMIETASPERMRHLEQVMANDGHLAELSRKAREEALEPARG